MQSGLKDCPEGTRPGWQGWRVAALFCFGLVAVLPTHGQAAYPDRALRMIVPWPAGQATDLGGRVIAQGEARHALSDQNLATAYGMDVRRWMQGLCAQWR